MRGRVPGLGRRIAVAVAAGLVSAALAAPGAAAAKPGPGVPASRGSADAGLAITIAAASHLRPVTGDVFVYFRTPGDAAATIYGDVTGAASGDVARLYAQPFPFRRRAAAVPGTTIALSPGSAPYTFTVTPGLATRYQVRVFGTGTRPLAVSRRATVYVSDGEHIKGGQKCSRPVCTEKFRAYEILPAAVIRRERAKHCYVYFSIRLSAVSKPPRPKWLYRDASATVSKPRRITAMKFERTVSFSFRVGHDGFFWLWTPCTKDTEAADGIGLPGRHGCGRHRVPADVRYLG